MIRANDLYKRFGEVEAVRGFDLEIDAGEIFALVGPDGAGKTTVMRLFCGALLPDRGEVFVQGISMRKEPDRAKEKIGYLSQRFSLYEELTVLENLRFFAEVRGLAFVDWQPRCLQILEFVGLAEYVDRWAGHLSGGMKQKLGLATALVHQPQILLLDEPTGGVDPVTRQDFWQLLFRVVAEEGVAVFVSTPYMDEAIRCSRVGFMKDGEITVHGPPVELLEPLKSRIIEVALREPTEIYEVLKQREEVEDIRIYGDRLRLRVRKGSLRKTMNWMKTALPHGMDGQVSIRSVSPKLEDIFISILSQDTSNG